MITLRYTITSAGTNRVYKRWIGSLSNSLDTRFLLARLLFLWRKLSSFLLWMDYDFRTRSGQSYDAQLPMYRTSSSSSAPSSHPMYGPSLYPRVGQPGPTSFPSAPNRPAPSPYQHHHTSTTTSAPSCMSNSSSILYLIWFDLILFDFVVWSYFLQQDWELGLR